MGSVTLLLVAPSMIYLHIPDDPSVVAAVGRIALRHGQLDYILRMTIKTLGGLSIQDALDATARLGSPRFTWICIARFANLVSDLTAA